MDGLAVTLSLPKTEESVRGVTWTKIDKTSTCLCERYMRIMAEMDRHYAKDDLGDLAEFMTSEGRAYYLGIGDGFELALGMRWYPRQKMYCVQSVGFRGDIEPWHAVDLVVAQARRFAFARRLRSVFAIVPDRMDNPGILQFYDILLWRKDFVVSGGRQVVGGKYWKLSLTADDQALLGTQPEVWPTVDLPGL